MEEPGSLSKSQATLEYWTLVEFFSPYHLESNLNSKQTYPKIYEGDATSSKLLPWLDAFVIPEHHPATPFAKGYNLYLGLFNVKETADRARHTFATLPSEWKSINWQACGPSTTCFARLTLTTHGIPLFGTLSLSTLPWAHGRLLEGKAELVTLEQYWKSVHRFILFLREEFSANLPKKLMKEPKQHGKYLDLESLTELVHHLYNWAGYRPTGYPLALVETLLGDPTQAAKDPQIKSERDIPILNSFYIQDLEAATASINHLQGKPLNSYLGNHQQERILLDSDQGAQTILSTIRPTKTPSGRFPDPPAKKQSLMQQFAINAAFDASVFSVNGPPGTGKTSLLREIIAENIVARAKALAQFTTPQQAFIGKQALNFENSDPIFVSELHPSLLGYEMLVVSSNNNAVQILSQELPLKSELAASYRHASYLETVATKALGLKENECWGLISSTLGNAENCRRFVENVFITPGKARYEARIWDWIDAYEGPSFAEARENFLRALEWQENHLEKLERLADLHEELKNHTDVSYCKEEQRVLTEAEEELEKLSTNLSSLAENEAEIKERLILLQEQDRLWKIERPGPLFGLFNREAKEAWGSKAKTIRNELLSVIEELHQCKTLQKDIRAQLAEQNEKVSGLTEQLLNRALLFYTDKEEYEGLINTYPDVLLPFDNQDLTHTETYYQSTESNDARSKLFIAAMAMHEAWLSEVLQAKGGFRGNLMAIASILQRKNPTTADDTRLAWQSVFLLIPVISSTFASIGRLFRYLEPGSLGWVLIDEAGQAIPQAAVGAIWRAKRVLSIGDPFQIEPICSIPPEVIDGMAKTRNKDYVLSWAPSQTSVQNLMDRASVFGANRTIRDESYWLGSPLRVHRRCLEPMFTISNAIAYESSMLLATPDMGQIPLPPSCWWDIRGEASDKQYVPTQGKALIDLLKEALLQMDAPDIFVISPFREVITQTQQLIRDAPPIKAIFKEKFPHISLHQWVQQAFGTVHTFQGKQTTAVFFVLGADKATLSAIEWASRKPNLLNVAVTRAQGRFYILGDYELWRHKPYFSVAAKKLQRLTIQR